MKHLRLIVQACFAALTNGYVRGFVEGKIYSGPLKQLCVPGLNCYSCPGALGACPIGALQAVLGSRGRQFSFYAIGFLVAVGALCGRFVCGWLCPFGLFQELVHKIPFPKKLKKLPGDKFLRMLKYIVLVLFVVILPLTVVNIVGIGDPWFCKYICPSGMLFGGIPLTILDEGIRSAAGMLFAWKFFILAVVILLSIVVYRPFCRYLCPLGAIYGLFNPVALLRYEVDSDKCIDCGKCKQSCPMDIDLHKEPGSKLCVRCGKCKKNCPTGAIYNPILAAMHKHAGHSKNQSV